MDQVREEIQRLILLENKGNCGSGKILSASSSTGLKVKVESEGHDVEDPEKSLPFVTADFTSLQVRDLLGYEFLEAPEMDEILRYNLEFKSEVKPQPIIIAGPHYSSGLSLDLLNQFRQQSSTSQGLIVLGISSCILLFGYNSWPFIAWAWPKLVSFSHTVEVTLCATWVQRFIETKPYKQFIIAWETGQPITPKVIQNFGPDILKLATSNIPDFLKVPKVMVKMQKLRANLFDSQDKDKL